MLTAPIIVIVNSLREIEPIGAAIQSERGSSPETQGLGYWEPLFRLRDISNNAGSCQDLCNQIRTWPHFPMFLRRIASLFLRWLQSAAQVLLV
jgi:hypothetical protein